MNEIEQPILIITGMHRSGTSLTASLLASAGLDIGKNLVGANEGNPRGHFENSELVDFHENVLYSLGIDKIGWTLNNKLTPPDRFLPEVQELIKQNCSHTQPWGWKEPRTTLFLDFWANLLPQAQFLFVVRRPWEVIDSLYRRGDDIFIHHPEFALQVWNAYNQTIFDFHQQYNRSLIINLQQIITNPNQLIEQIQSKLSITLGEVDSSLYEPNLLKQEVSQSWQRLEIIKNYFPESLELYQQLNQLANYEDDLIKQLNPPKTINSWILQDWLNVKQLERKLRDEQKQYHTHLDQLYQELGGVKANIAEVENELQISTTEKLTLKENLLDCKEKLTKDLQESLNQQQKLNKDLQELRYHHHKLILDLEQLQQQRDQLQENLTEIEHKFAQSQAEVEQLRFKINQLNSLIESSQIYTQDIENKYNDLQNHIKNLEQESRQKQSQLEQILHQEQQTRIIAQDRISAMETSKFWKLRKKWFKLKRGLGMGENE